MIARRFIGFREVKYLVDPNKWTIHNLIKEMWYHREYKQNYIAPLNDSVYNMGPFKKEVEELLKSTNGSIIDIKGKKIETNFKNWPVIYTYYWGLDHILVTYWDVYDTHKKEPIYSQKDIDRIYEKF